VDDLALNVDRWQDRLDLQRQVVDRWDVQDLDLLMAVIKLHHPETTDCVGKVHHFLVQIQMR
jgi:hypothetical protein